MMRYGPNSWPMKKNARVILDDGVGRRWSPITKITTWDLIISAQPGILDS